ncbi:hydantoinase/oxoprolinase family protein [Chloroflexota bacterium]
MFEITIDTGGTFTDAVLRDEEKNIKLAKFLTDASDPGGSIMGCIELLAKEQSISQKELLAGTHTISIGTTLPTNAILEEKGAKCCLIHTKGFRDIFELGRTIPKEDIYNLKIQAPKVLIPRYLRFGVEERVQYDGGLLTPLNENDVLEAVKKAKDHGIEIPVVCFLHSYINPVNEEKAGEILKSEFPNVVLSSRILRRWIEYDRLSTATFTAYIKPIMIRFIETLEKRLKQAHFKGVLLFNTGLGYVATGALALDNPGNLIGSGPAGGALMGRFLGEKCGFENVLTCDMGGTSLDIGVLYNRIINTTSENILANQKCALETMDIPSMGAGGGSVAWIDRLGVLRVGPQSAGANPGPACYDRGGENPTITDANVVLGYVPHDYFLGGTMVLNREKAEKAIDEKIAKPLDMSTIEAAYAISSLAETLMAERIFLSIVERGYDPADFSIVSGGGAGGVHAAALASKLGIKQVYVPKFASTFAALGGAVADYGYVLNRFYYRRDDEADANHVKALYDDMEKEAREIFAKQGVNKKDMTIMREAEVRYYGQLRDIDVMMPETKPGQAFTKRTLKELVANFHSRHNALYGWSDPNLPATIALLKLRAVGKRPDLELKTYPKTSQDSTKALKRRRQVYFKNLGGFVATPCYDGDKLKHGNVITGPAIIEETKTTIVVPKGATLTVDAYLNYLIRR